MKIIHVLNAYLPEHIAGTEVYVAALTRELHLKQIESVILIPNTKDEKEEYYFEDVKVIKYAESSVADRDTITGQKAPPGLQNFLYVLKNENPDIVHFHELAGSIGIGNFHVEAAKKAGFKSVMTFHVVKYSCKTGTLMYMGKSKCDGIIDAMRCSKCWVHYKGENGFRKDLIIAGFSVMNFVRIDTRFIKNELGTALAFPKIVTQLKNDLLRIEKNTAKFVVLTQWYKDILIKNGIDKNHIELIYQGLPTINRKPDFTKKNNSKLKVVFVGRISHFKGVDILIAAIQLLSRDEIELDIYGAATDKKYEEFCYQLSKSMDNVFWKGSIEPELVIETIQHYDIICIPSAVSEMGPFVLKEASAAMVPAIASNVYGNAEQIIDGKNGWLFNFNDSNDLKNKLQQLINDPSLIEKAKQHITPVKSFDRVAEEHEKLYKEILAVE